MHGFDFSERVRKVLARARDEANGLRHEYVGTEHLVLALVGENEGVAWAVFQSLGVDTDAVAQKIHEVVRRGHATDERRADLPYTSRAKKAIELAMGEARDLGHGYVGTEHLLLGLLAEEKGIGAQVLMDHGLRIEAARSETLRLLGAPPATAPDAAPRAPAARSSSGGLSRFDFTDAARNALGLARDETVRRGADAVTVADLLVGLLALEDGAAAAILDRTGLDRRTLRDAIAAAPAASAEAAPVEAPPQLHALSGPLHRVLRYAAVEANEERYLRVGTQHLLLAAVREHEDAGATAVREAGLTPDAVRAAYARIAG